ncbi:MAG: hypothetical protein FWE40_09970 [Oscillospiraceae bacterium]|nr:hypothetical protein [Oscillospiraceae bacterium]
MRKLLALFVALLVLAGCGMVAAEVVHDYNDYTATTLPAEETTRFVYAQVPAPTSALVVTPLGMRTCWCEGECFFAQRIKIARSAAAPLNISDDLSDEFLTQFNHAHTLTFPITDRPSLHDNFVFWTDEPLRDFSFVGIHAGWCCGQETYVNNTFFTMDELLPGEAFVLLNWLGPYQFPTAGFTFIDQSGEQRYMFFKNQDHGPYCLPVLWNFGTRPS